MSITSYGEKECEVIVKSTKKNALIMFILYQIIP